MSCHQVAEQPMTEPTDLESRCGLLRSLHVPGSPLVLPVAGHLLGPVDRRYLAGWSDSSETVKRIVDSGLAEGVFELALPITTDQPFDPQDALAAGRYHGKVITLDSEFEWFYARAAEDRGASPALYRSYFVPGSPHVPDPLCPLFSNETTPASWTPELRARFAQGDAWVKTGAPPPPSTRLATTSSGDIDREQTETPSSWTSPASPCRACPRRARRGHFS